MRESLKNQIEKYALARKKRRIRRQVACLLSVCIAVTVFGALMQPAVSREKRDPLLEAETLHAQPGSPDVGEVHGRWARFPCPFG